MKIIKHGKKEFQTICSRCGCEFSYTLEELLSNYPVKTVNCPDCGYECYHPDQSTDSNKDLYSWITEKALSDTAKGYVIPQSSTSYDSQVDKSTYIYWQ